MKLITLLVIIVWLCGCSNELFLNSNLSDQSKEEVLVTSVFTPNSLAPQVKFWGEVISDGEKGYIPGPTDISGRDSGIIGEGLGSTDTTNLVGGTYEDQLENVLEEKNFVDNSNSEELGNSDLDDNSLHEVDIPQSNITDNGDISLQSNHITDAGNVLSYNTNETDNGNISHSNLIDTGKISIPSNNTADTGTYDANTSQTFSNSTDSGVVSNSGSQDSAVSVISDSGSGSNIDSGIVNNSTSYDSDASVVADSGNGDDNAINTTISIVSNDTIDANEKQHGNNGVGNGVDPEPFGNPFINDGEETALGLPGHKLDCGTGKQKCARCKKCEKSIKLKFVKICSTKRSKIPYPNFVFFEEMKNPIVSFEVSYIKEKPSLAMPFLKCFKCDTEEIEKRVLIYKALNPDQLFQGNNIASLSVDKKLIRKTFTKSSAIQVLVCDDTNNNGYCSDEKSEFIVSLSKPTFSAWKIPRTIVIDVWHGRNYSINTDKNNCERQYSPLVLDLLGNGISLTGPESLIKFDLDDTGKSIYTGWPIGEDDAFLVRDVNGNGKIDSGAELFGSATVLKNGLRASDGFSALSEWDDNNDGKISKEDRIWRELRLWIDSNHNGKSETKELYRPKKLGLEYVDLNYVFLNEVDEHGNATRMRSTFGREGKIGVIVDIWFNTFLEE